MGFDMRLVLLPVVSKGQSISLKPVGAIAMPALPSWEKQFISRIVPMVCGKLRQALTPRFRERNSTFCIHFATRGLNSRIARRPVWARPRDAARQKVFPTANPKGIGSLWRPVLD